MSDTFDRGRLLTACGGDAELAGQVVGVFLSDTPKQLNNLEVALAGALRFQAGISIKPAGAFAVRPRWPLAELTR